MKRSRAVGLVGSVALVVILSGCIGGAPAPGAQQTTAPQPDEEATSGSEGRQSATMGPIPPLDERTKKALNRLQAKQDEIDSYRATVTETTVTQLSNGSELTRVQKWNIAVKYTDEGVLTRAESWRPGSSEERSFRIHNRTASIQYVPSEDEYRVRKDSESNRGDHGDFFAHARTENGSYSLFEPPLAVIERENSIQYIGTERVNGRETAVIGLDGNPNGGNLAYYAARTLWVDTETGFVLKQRAQKPRLDSMQRISVAEVMNPEANNSLNDSDDDPNAVYLGDKTITTTYTNVSINDVPDSIFDPDIPEDGDVEVSTQEER